MMQAEQQSHGLAIHHIPGITVCVLLQPVYPRARRSPLPVTVRGRTVGQQGIRLPWD